MVGLPRAILDTNEMPAGTNKATRNCLDFKMINWIEKRCDFLHLGQTFPMAKFSDNSWSEYLLAQSLAVSGIFVTIKFLLVMYVRSAKN